MPLSNKPLSHYASAGIKEVFEELHSSDKGISHSEAEKRLKEFGHNHVVEKKNLGIFIEFLSHFKNPLVIILIIASLVSAYFGQVLNAGIIGVIILLSVFLDSFLEHNAKKAAERLREHVRTKAMVIRNGERKETKIEDLCVGDVIVLSAGNMVPADARVIGSKDFF